jgi:hypothetical protein
MLKNYRYLLFIDSGVADEQSLNAMVEASRQFAAGLELELQVEKSDVWILREFLINHSNDHFHMVKRGGTVTPEIFNSMR